MVSHSTKPVHSTWTDEQWDAISLSGQNMLVAAAAGSGKTAVLVERIIRRISDETNPIDVDRLLVATFTKAAAAEMRHRIRDALEMALFNAPESHHLRKQLALINRASITTLHSFCMEVIQRYFQLIDLDPGFRIANETEAALLRQDQLEELLEECYADSPEGSEFWRLIECFSGERSDEALLRLIQHLYDDSRSHPQPETWLRRMAELFDVDDQAVYDGSHPWQASLTVDVRLELNGVIGLLREAIRIAEQPHGPTPYLENLHSELIMVEYLHEVSHHSWGHLYQAFQSASFGRLKPCKGDDIDKSLQDNVKHLRESAKEQLLKIKLELFERTPEQFYAELREIAPLMHQLVDLVVAFGERYQQAKTKKGLVDFADLEHYCLQVLTHPDSVEGELLPSQAALDYQSQFVEVLLDEYQDTNRVQEAIVELISNSTPGNRFMVGDVKQSIYRFRLAEPGLFLEKYKAYAKDGTISGRRIDLARNFRSRRQVVDGVNFIFKQMMHETVGEIEYDRSAELVCGANYPDWDEGIHVDELNLSVELLLIDRTADGISSATGDFDGEERQDDGGDEPLNDTETESGVENEPQELETAQLEARLIALQMKQLMGGDGKQAFPVYDPKAGATRPITYRDMVILMRATQQWAPVMIEELRLQGIPAYADLNTGYFKATEVEVVLSLLKIVDNPLQDIPLAAVLRSPMVGLTADQLAQIRLASKQGGYYDALLSITSRAQREAAAQVDERDHVADELMAKLDSFLRWLNDWRGAARQGSLADLIWRVYRETGYYDFVGGMPGGTQRQANLRALYDRARQYEATSFRGLFRFLRFIERMQDGGGDLGTARALGEQEDVVRIMTIHKSKGLEFPVVFVAGLAKRFNQQDLSGSFLLHKELGFGPRFIDTALRVSYPTLASLAIKRRLHKEMLAEEMRVLYVALTRAREKLYLLGTVKMLEKEVHKWASVLEVDEWAMPDYGLAKARCYLDWLGPAIIRHPLAKPLRDAAGVAYRSPSFIAEECSIWKTAIFRPSQLISGISTAVKQEAGFSEKWEAIQQQQKITFEVDPVRENLQTEVAQRLSWRYKFEAASQMLSKTSVSEMKRLSELRGNVVAETFTWDATRMFTVNEEGSDPSPLLTKGEDGTITSKAPSAFSASSGKLRRPRFMEQQKLTAAERGTVYHAIMQQVPLDPDLTQAHIEAFIRHMLELRLLTAEQSDMVDPTVIAGFFASELGQRLLNSERVLRETPFSYGLRAGQIYPGTDASVADETILIQGVIDCLFEDAAGLIMLDYKTDAVHGQGPESIAERYRVQMDLYSTAVEKIWKRPVAAKYLFLFDGAHVVEIN